MPSLEIPEAFYGETQRALQVEFDSTNLADIHSATIITDTISDEQRAFIEGRDFFFLSTVNAEGWPTVSYKGGSPGFVKVSSDQSISFPLYDGNGMFLSGGNVEATAKIGMLFIDFERPDRLRLHATATVSRSSDLLAQFPGAQLVIEARIDNVFLNCARYIHKHRRTEDSPYVPDADGQQPYASWKRIDLMQPFLPSDDQGRADEAGGEITVEDYLDRLSKGTS